jgi:hypothetical protein
MSKTLILMGLSFHRVVDPQQLSKPIDVNLVLSNDEDIASIKFFDTLKQP